MAVHGPWTFNSINSERYAQLVEKARAAGIDISGNSGTASKYGIEIAWNYLPGEEQLTFQCLKMPFFVSAADVEAKIRGLVAATLTA